ncbi:hypothetical protein [Schlesneria paludicola]|uniref:hypothetical protein n=1 Tax=Schlesneria paludicola TaxID=360056 RepID=UPI00029AFDC4|nr:hypothetical protein [Schlesneria paludicola]
MWAVRLISILPLLAAMLLPPGLFRDCCCARRAQLEQRQQAPVRSCCRLKSAVSVRAVSRKPSDRPLVTTSPCRCKLAIAPVAVIEAKSRVAIDSSRDLVALPIPADIRPDFGAVLASIGDQSPPMHLLGPPERSMLCRWNI